MKSLHVKRWMQNISPLYEFPSFSKVLQWNPLLSTRHSWVLITITCWWTPATKSNLPTVSASDTQITLPSCRRTTATSSSMLAKNKQCNFFKLRTFFVYGFINNIYKVLSESNSTKSPNEIWWFSVHCLSKFNKDNEIAKQLNIQALQNSI